jgi:mono/diheme cytochrome c family protein
LWISSSWHSLYSTGAFDEVEPMNRLQGKNLRQSRNLACSLPLFLLLFLFFAISILGCRPKDDASNQGVPTGTKERGRTIYQTQCIACHHSDPHKSGVLGPEVFGSSRELIEVRVLKAEYPSGYQPKRQTRTMVPLPHLKSEIESLTLYLNSRE